MDMRRRACGPLTINDIADLREVLVRAELMDSLLPYFKSFRHPIFIDKYDSDT